MKHLRGMCQRVPMHSMQRSWSRMRWIVGLVVVVGCCFFVSAHRGAKAHDTSSSTAVSNNTSLADKSPIQASSTGVPSAHVPPTFGKSHFIVGMSAEETARRCSLVPVAHKTEEAVNAYDMVCLGVFPQVLFSPHDDVRKTLVYLIDHEKKSIKIAAYTVTEPKVAQALVAAIKRGVFVSLVVDRSCLDMTSQKIKILRKAGAEIAVFDGKTREDGALMHNKFYLFEENLKNKQLVWTGSANTTRSAYERNHENVNIFEGTTLFGRYTKEFELLMTVAERLKS